MSGWRDHIYVALGMALLVCSACLQPPKESVAAATAAYEEAVEVEAHRYSPESLALASRALEAALAEVEREKHNKSLIRDYAHARVLLGRALQLARGARYEALARRDEVRRETAIILERASRALAALEEGVTIPGDTGSAEWRTWIRRFRQASDTLTEARRSFREADYFEAYAQAGQVVDKLREIEGSRPSS